MILFLVNAETTVGRSHSYAGKCDRTVKPDSTTLIMRVQSFVCDKHSCVNRVASTRLCLSHPLSVNEAGRVGHKKHKKAQKAVPAFCDFLFRGFSCFSWPQEVSTACYLKNCHLYFCVRVLTMNASCPCVDCSGGTTHALKWRMDTSDHVPISHTTSISCCPNTKPRPP